MNGALLALTLAAAPVPPSSPAPPPSVHDRLEQRDRPTAIFTYQIDGRCRVDNARKLQGRRELLWRQVAAALEITRERTIWRFMDNTRTQLRERRVKLRGEMVRQGELVCHVRPSGDVVKAWIERKDTSIARRRTPTQDPVTVRDGRIADLGTFSVTFEPPVEDAAT